MSFNQLFLLLAPLVGGMMLAYGVSQVAMDLRKTDKKRLMNRLRGGAGSKKRSVEDEFDDLRRQTTDAKGLMATLFGRLKFTQSLQTALEQADVPWSAPNVMGNLTAIASITFAVLFLMGVSLIASTVAALAAFVLPLMWLFGKRKSRLKKLVLQLPDIFELLSQALRAGHSLASGMQLVSREVPAPAGKEFGRVFHEQNLGLKIEDALRNLANRTDVLDIRFFVTAVLIQRQTGGDLAEVLDKIGSVIRDRIKLFGTVQALTAEGRLSGWVLMALPPLVFIAMVFINPDYCMLLITDPLGKMMLTGAITMQVLGYLMIQKIVNIKV